MILNSNRKYIIILNIKKISERIKKEKTEGIWMFG